MYKPNVVYNNYKKDENFISPFYRKSKNITKLRNQHYNNFDCKDDLYNCIGLDTSNKITFNLLGSGTFGTVFKITDSKGISYAVKIIETLLDEDTLIDQDNTIDFSEFEKELDLTYYMGLYSLGPKLYKSFYYILNKHDLKKRPELYNFLSIIEKQKQENDPNYSLFSENEFISVQCMIMESFQNNVNEVLKSEKIDNSIKTDVILQICNILYKQIFEFDIYCFDIKTSNFVANINSNSATVRMIDYGADYCNKKNPFPKFEIPSGNYSTSITQLFEIIKTFSDSPLIEQKEFLYVSNVLQLFSHIFSKMFGMYFDSVISFNNTVVKAFELHKPTIEFAILSENDKLKKLFNYMISGWYLFEKYDQMTAPYTLAYYWLNKNPNQNDIKKIANNLVDFIPIINTDALPSYTTQETISPTSFVYSPKKSRSPKKKSHSPKKSRSPKKKSRSPKKSRSDYVM